MWKSLWLRALSLSIGLAIADAVADDNLLSNPDLTSASGVSGAISDWSLTDGWTKGDIPSFQGFPFSMFYVSRKNAGSIRQENIPVEKNKWYVLEAWYNGDLTLDPANNLWLNVCRARKTGETFDYPLRFSYSEYGAVNDWVKLRHYFNSGDHDRVGFLAKAFGKGDVRLGRLSLHALEDADFQGPWFQDGDLERGLVGKAPLEIIPCQEATAVVTDREACHGKHSAKLTTPANIRGPSFILSPRIPATPGDTITLSLMAKTSGPEVVGKISLTRQGAPQRVSVGVKLDTTWKKISCSITAPEVTAVEYLKLVPGPQVYLGTLTFENAAAGTEVFIDDLRATLERKGDTDKQPIYGVPGNPLKNSSFEAGLDGWSPRFCQAFSDDAWPLKFGSATIDEANAVEGSRSLKIVVPQKDAGGSSSWLRSVYLPVELDKPYTVSFWAKTNMSAPVKVALRDWWNGSAKTVPLVPGEWRRYSATVVPKVDNAGFNYLSFMFAMPGTYWLDAIQVEPGDKMTDYRVSENIEVGADFAKTYPWYRLGEKPEIKVSRASRFDDDRPAKLVWETRDWRKRVVDRGEKNVMLFAKKSSSEFLSMYGKSFGAFHVTLTLIEPKSGAKVETETVYGVFPETRDIPPEKSCFGIHFNCDYGVRLVLPGGNLDEALSLFNMLGARWERSFYVANWKMTWPEENRWVWFDRYIDAFRGKGVKIMPILGPRMRKVEIPEWCLNDSDRDDGPVKPIAIDMGDRLPRLDAWKTYVRTLVTHYGDKIDAWEVWNETGGLSPKYYVQFAKTAHEAIADIKDRPRLVGPDYPCQGLPWPDRDDSWIGRVFKLGFYPYVDVLSAHYYPPGTMYGGGPSFEGGTNRYGDREEELLKQIDNVWKTYGKKPLWDSEYGVLGRSQVRGWEQPSNPFNVRSASPEQQARRLTIWNVIRLAAGFERLFYHTLAGPAYPPGGYIHSLSEFNLAPAPVTIAYTQLARRLDDFKFEKRHRVTPTIWTYVFTADRKTVGIYWNYAAEKDGEIRFSLSPEKVLAEDIMGNPVTPKVVSGGIELPLGLNPIYLVSDKLTPDEMAKAFIAAIPTDIKTVEPAIGMADGPAIAVGVKNIVTWPVSGDVTLKALPNGWETVAKTVPFALEKGNENIKVFPLTRYCPESGETVAVATYDGSMTEMRRTLYLAKARPAKVIADGDISAEEYGGGPTIVMNDSEQAQLPAGMDPGVSLSGYAWDGQEKGSAEVYAAWEPDTLFLGIKIKDDTIQNDAPDNKLWSQDSIEIYFDTNPSGNLFSPGVYSSCQGRLTVAPPKNGGERPRFIFEKTPGGVPKHFDVARARFAYQKTNVGYNLEIALPTCDLTFNVGKVLGFFINLNDVDRPERAKVSLLWRKVGNNNFYRDHSLWGYLLITQ